MNEQVHIHNSMQKGYTYTRTRRPGAMSDHPDFQPYFTPLVMLRMGIFEGRYLDPNNNEFPASWRRYLHTTSDAQRNYFHIKSRRPLPEWRANGWIHPDDPRGWFEWYCRFYLGRRHSDDARQIARWKSFGARHSGAIRKNCPALGNPTHPNTACRPRQRQGLLQWAHDPFV